MRIGGDVWTTDPSSLAAVVLEALGAIESEKEGDRVNVVVEDNHEHRLVVPEEDVMRGEEKAYDIQGDARHDHSVTITPAMFARLVRGETLTVRSSETNIHAHTVSIRFR